MTIISVKGGNSQEVLDGSQGTLSLLAITTGTGLIHVGEPSPEGFDVPFRGGDQVILPANLPATLRADGFVVTGSVGQYGGQTYEGGGSLPSNQAIVTDSEIVTAIGGQTIDIQVTDNVATFGVRSFPFWNPFTVTAADLGGSFGYQADVPDKDPAGAITNEPVDGYTLIWARTFLDGGNAILTLQMAGPRPLMDALQGALFGINAEDYSVAYGDMQVFEGSGVFYTTIEIYDVPMWTAGQSIPIVIIPQS